MNKIASILILASLMIVQSHAKNNNYTLVVEGYDWGPGASKVILPMEDSVSKASAADFQVYAIRRTSSSVELSPERAEGERKVIYAYVSDAGNVHFSYYDHVVDLSGIYGGTDYHYAGHSSWIYSHANHCFFDYDGSAVKVDGRPVKIMEWLAAQHK